MKHLHNFINFLIVILPMLWIEDYTISNPILWTVFGVAFFSILNGYFECVDEEDENNVNTKI